MGQIYGYHNLEILGYSDCSRNPKYLEGVKTVKTGILRDRIFSQNHGGVITSITGDDVAHGVANMLLIINRQEVVGWGLVGV